MSLDGAPVAIAGEVPGVLPWLREVLVPGFDVVGAGGATGAPRVEVAAADPTDTAPLDGSFPCFALDREVLHLAGRATGSGWVLADDRWGIRFVLGPGGARVSPSRPGARLRMAAFRVVRELATVRALGAGGATQLHAACVSWEGRGIVLAGPKRAGKTTLLARLAAATDAGIVANDRVLLRETDRGWHATGVPTIVSVRPGTQQQMPELFRSIAAVDRPIDLTLAEAAEAAAHHGTAGTLDRLSLSPPQFAHAVGSRLDDGVPLGAVAVVAVDPTADPFHVRRMSRAEAAEALREVRFGAHRDAGAPSVFERAFDPDGVGRSDHGVLSALTGAAWFRVGVGASLLRSPTAPEELLRALSVAG